MVSSPEGFECEQNLLFCPTFYFNDSGHFVFWILIISSNKLYRLQNILELSYMVLSLKGFKCQQICFSVPHFVLLMKVAILYFDKTYRELVGRIPNMYNQILVKVNNARFLGPSAFWSFCLLVFRPFSLSAVWSFVFRTFGIVFF